MGGSTVVLATLLEFHSIVYTHVSYTHLDVYKRQEYTHTIYC